MRSATVPPRTRRLPLKRATWALGAATILALPAQPAAGGGGPENILVIIAPGDPDSSYLGNHYVSARLIPPRNVVYLRQNAEDYSAFANHQLEAVLGEVSNRGIGDHIDYVVVATGSVYRLSAAGHISDNECIGLSHLSLPSAYTTAHLANAILAGDSDEPYGLTTTESNAYSSETDSAIAFGGNLRWVNGSPTLDPDAPRYLIAAMLGYTGPRGNTPGEIVAMIDRSVAADGTQPDGTFYFIKTTNMARSGPRDLFFTEVIDSIIALGGEAEEIEAVLPEGHHDCLGIMTGWADPWVETADMTILPGAFCDHLTSWAATFDQSQQTKVSAWIAKGAGGSHGAVEELCNDGGKFPHPRTHVYYYQGLSLGEAVLRGLRYLSFQTLLYGDPLVQPFAHIPTVNVPDAPTGVVSGTIVLTPQATTTKPEAEIAKLNLFVDGLLLDSISPDEAFSLDTSCLPDGAHDVRIVAFDDSAVASQGRWMQSVTTDNFGRSVSLSVEPAAGDLSTAFTISVSTPVRGIAETRVMQNGRVLAATPNQSDALVVSGATLGGGSVRLSAEAEFNCGDLAYSEVCTVEIDFGGACCAPNGVCRQLSQDACADLCGGTYAGDGTSCSSNPCASCRTGDFDGSSSVDILDFASLQGCYSGPDTPPEDDPPGHQIDCLCTFDFDEEQDVDLLDYEAFSGRLTGPCPEPSNEPPVAFDYIKHIRRHEPSIVEFPATDADGDPLSYTVLTPPVQASLEGSGPTRVLRPGPFATGTDAIEFRVEDPQGAADIATVALRYPDSPPTSFSVEVSALGAADVPIWYSPADLSGRSERTTAFVTWFANDGSDLTLTAPDTFGVSPFVRWVIDGDIRATSETDTIVSLDQNVIAVATYMPCRSLAIRSNRSSVFVNLFPTDIEGHGGGVAPFERIYATDTEGLLLLAPSCAGAHTFRHWKLDWVVQGTGNTALFIGQMNENHTAIAVYANIPGDVDYDGDVDAGDFSEFQCCFSGDSNSPGFEPPSPDCLSLFDLEEPTDGDVDLMDFAEVAAAMTGPF
jgi:uncharacterized protein (TIGR03790 family)